ncbi:tetraspanin-18-like isoform X2 [Lytechinus variegatus]|uniref:tetraspanin-18-like isoform X2 n=1 Tax=Lytechinus variegatus TaxID=7654 RepID=UPI001BB0E52A|nr:tetraspanin-18-like isoform X2 [Lytechinus variegatus]XP_041472369.1 tetraspanin-18-like isoform X2 [Lytechinus variegatus]
MAEDKHDTAEIATKYLLILFNFLFLLVGVALISVGIVVIVHTNQIYILEILDNPLIRNGAYLIIGLGCFIIVVSVVGYFGACMESRCTLIIYIIILVIIFIAQLVGCILLLAYRSQVTSTLFSSIDSYQGEDANNDTTSTGWNAIQILFECCGIDGYEDWADSTWVNDTNPTITIDGISYDQTYPATCCVSEDKFTSIFGGYWPTPLNISSCMGIQGPLSNDTLNTRGCYNVYYDFVTSQVLLVCKVGFGLLLLELIPMAFAAILYHALSRRDNNRRFYTGIRLRSRQK